ncbi:hypothetical protein [Paenibacillus wulumuqiensis]|uniref:hypothetical protein n=1 Tax=Paenibacillus wulumuqiensis TaxID=1567107 RepID=UPI0006193D62|nr:hypothetical protein [Paenibacillus wulumuqiensis]
MDKNIEFSLFILTLKNFQNKNFAEKALELMSNTEEFSPKIFDRYKPLKKEFKLENMKEMLDIWMNEEANKEGLKDEIATGIFTAAGDKRYKVSYFISWKKIQYAHFNLFVMSANAVQLIENNLLNDFMNKASEFIDLFEPTYGYMGFERNNGLYPIDLQVRLPELEWITLLGKNYIDLFGREKLLSTPCYKIHEFNKNIIGIQLTESIDDMPSQEIMSAVKRHLGVQAFVEAGRNIYRHKPGLVPQFDFTEIMFDSEKPLKYPQIHRRK